MIAGLGSQLSVAVAEPVFAGSDYASHSIEMSAGALGSQEYILALNRQGQLSDLAAAVLPCVSAGTSAEDGAAEVPTSRSTARNGMVHFANFIVYLPSLLSIFSTV